MTLKAFNLLRIILSSSISLGLYFTIDYRNVQSQPITSTDNKQVKSVKFNPPQASDEDEASFEDDGKPVTRVPGSDRDTSCPAIYDVPLTALISEMSPIRTVLEHPTFLFYVPYTSSNGYQLELIVQDSQEDDIYEESFSLPEISGIIPITLPSDISLQLNQEYSWFLYIYCDAEHDSKYVAIEAVVERVAMTDELQRDLLANEAQQYLAYAKHGIWYDAIAHLAELRYREPENMQFQNDWRIFLENEDINLSSIVEKPILDCCTSDRTTPPTN